LIIYYASDSAPITGNITQTGLKKNNTSIDIYVSLSLFIDLYLAHVELLLLLSHQQLQLLQSLRLLQLLLLHLQHDINTADTIDRKI
jgi:hypothetical protein